MAKRSDSDSEATATATATATAIQYNKTATATNSKPKKSKNQKGNFENMHPPSKIKSTFRSGSFTQNVCTTQTL